MTAALAQGADATAGHLTHHGTSDCCAFGVVEETDRGAHHVHCLCAERMRSAQIIAAEKQMHSHPKTCKKPPQGEYGCRMAYEYSLSTAVSYLMKYLAKDSAALSAQPVTDAFCASLQPLSEEERESERTLSLSAEVHDTQAASLLLG